MRYAIRAVKYFIYITLVFAVVIWVLASLSAGKLVTTPEGVVASLVHGWNSVFLILGVFAAFSCLYPMLGYIKRPLSVGGSVAELKDSIDAFMAERGYEFEKENQESLCYRIKGGMSRLTRTYEDRVTITQTAGGLQMEGLRKDVVRLSLGLEARLGSQE